jgi:hypothetical protein
MGAVACLMISWSWLEVSTKTDSSEGGTESAFASDAKLFILAKAISDIGKHSLHGKPVRVREHPGRKQILLLLFLQRLSQIIIKLCLDKLIFSQ